MKFLNFIFITIFALSINAGYAAKITDDTLAIGRPGSSANKDLKLGTRIIRSNESTGKLEFSNDGTLYKNLGSGSGTGSGGINVLANPSFEDGLTPGWTNSGGTFTQQPYSSGIEGNSNFARFVATASGQFVETTLTAVPSFLGAGCQAQFEKYATVTDGAWRIVVLDSSSNVLATQNFNQSGGATTFIASPLLSFPCPVSPNTFKVRLESLAAATIDFDLAYGGGNKNTVDIAQARLAGESFWAGFAGVCVHQRTSTTLGPLTGSTGCPGPTIASSSIGQWQTTDTDSLRQTINNLPAGRYKATYQVNTFMTAGAANSFAITDGSTTCAEIAGTTNVNTSPLTISCVFEYTTTGNRNFELLTRSASSTVNINGDSGTGYSRNNRFTLEYYPNDSQTAVTSDQSSWIVDVNIGGANPSLGTTSISTYTGITDASLDMVLGSSSAAAKIPCSSTNASTGLTCSAGNESVGVVFTNPTVGWYKACFDFSHLINGTNADAYSTFQLVETASNSQSIVQDGRIRKTSGNTGGATTVTTAHSVNLCGVFYFSSIQERAIRLFYEQSIGNTAIGVNLYGDRSSTNGQRDIHIEVYPIISAHNRPYFTGDQVTSPGTANIKTFYANYGGAGSLTSQSNCTSTPCTEYRDTAGTLSLARTNTGAYALTGAAGTCKPNVGLFVGFSANNNANGLVLKISGANDLATDANGGFVVQGTTQIDGGANTDTRTSWKIECEK